MKSACTPLLVALAICVSGCASRSTEVESRPATEEDIEAILTEPLSDADYVEAKRCLAGPEYRSFRVLDDRHILFEGGRGQLWLNVLPIQCPDLRFATALQVDSTFSMSRICASDRFQPADWFDWPWYRRWPWDWGWDWSSGVRCILGEFQPVTEAQVQAIRQALRQR